VQRVAPTSGCVLPAGHGVHAPGGHENGRLILFRDLDISLCYLHIAISISVSMHRVTPTSGCVLPAGHAVHDPGRDEHGRLREF